MVFQSNNRMENLHSNERKPTFPNIYAQEPIHLLVHEKAYFIFEEKKPCLIKY